MHYHCLMKLSANIQRVSGHSWKDFQGHGVNSMCVRVFEWDIHFNIVAADLFCDEVCVCVINQLSTVGVWRHHHCLDSLWRADNYVTSTSVTPQCCSQRRWWRRWSQWPDHWSTDSRVWHRRRSAVDLDCIHSPLKVPACLRLVMWRRS